VSDPLQAVLQLGIPATDPYPATSRYHGLPTRQLVTAAGRIIAYAGRRFSPQPESLALLQLHTVTQGDRLDNVTAAYLGDPEQFWRICDANGALRPDELTAEIGRRLRITLPEGLPGQRG
jgi:hypothetical protein